MAKPMDIRSLIDRITKDQAEQMRQHEEEQARKDRFKQIHLLFNQTMEAHSKELGRLNKPYPNLSIYPPTDTKATLELKLGNDIPKGYCRIRRKEDRLIIEASIARKNKGEGIHYAPAFETALERSLHLDTEDHNLARHFEEVLARFLADFFMVAP